MKLKIPIGYKFILGFIAVVAVAAFVPGFVEKLGVVEWLQQPLSLLTAIVIGLLLGSFFTKSFTRRFNILTNAAFKMSRGDLTRDEDIDKSASTFADETSDLAEAIELMRNNLRGLVEHINETVANLGEAQEMFSSVVRQGARDVKGRYSRHLLYLRRRAQAGEPHRRRHLDGKVDGGISRRGSHKGDRERECLS